LRLELVNDLNRIEEKRGQQIMPIHNRFVKANICVLSLRNTKNKINSLAALFVLTTGAEYIRNGVELCSLFSKPTIDLKFKPTPHILSKSF
jgi:hypothetical protein